MIHPRAPHLALLVATALALTACGGAPPEPAATQQEPAPAASEGASAPAGDTASGGELIGLVGTAEDPDAYEIALTDDSGAPVTSLPAGDYTLTFADLSSIHNFRLTGPGDVDVSTEVGAVDESSVEVTLVPGTYEIVCDPHAGTMRGTVEVTG
jgi:hypothetical protein